MDMSKNNTKKKAVSAAVWSVKAEGLKPTKSAISNLNAYASGKITVSEMKQNTVRNVQKIIQSSK